MIQQPTLGGLLEKAGARYRVFDLGRRVSKISQSRFNKVELAEIPYPQPLQQQALLGILFWDRAQPDQHFVWFLRFPLDEMGHLQAAARDDFIEGVLRALSDAQGSTGGLHALPQESPYAFKPREERLAAFHAKALVELGQPPSRHYAHAKEYLAGRLGFEQWAFVGLQGLADVTARLGRDDNADCLAGAIPHLPLEPLSGLCLLLENEPLPGRIGAVLQERLLECLAGEEVSLAEIGALVRAVGNTKRGDVRHRMVSAVLGSRWGAEVDLLVVIAGRAWEALQDEALRLRYLEALAGSPTGREVFPTLMRDLLFVPGMRPLLLASFRNPARSPRLAEAIGALLQGALR